MKYLETRLSFHLSFKLLKFTQTHMESILLLQSLRQENTSVNTFASAALNNIQVILQQVHERRKKKHLVIYQDIFHSNVNYLELFVTWWNSSSILSANRKQQRLQPFNQLISFRQPKLIIRLALLIIYANCIYIKVSLNRSAVNRKHFRLQRG